MKQGAFHYIPGRGSVVGDAIVHHKDVSGITFTGSYEVGMSIYKTFARNWATSTGCYVMAAVRWSSTSRDWTYGAGCKAPTTGWLCVCIAK